MPGEEITDASYSILLKIDSASRYCQDDCKDKTTNTSQHYIYNIIYATNPWTMRAMDQSSGKEGFFKKLRIIQEKLRVAGTSHGGENDSACHCGWIMCQRQVTFAPV